MRKTRKPNAPVKIPPAGGTDQIEQQAAETAQKRGKTRTTDADRKSAYQELRRTAPKVSEKKSPAH